MKRSPDVSCSSYLIVNLIHGNIEHIVKLIYNFHRDGGLPFSRFFARVSSRFMMPLNSLYLTTILVVIFGCIFLGSSSAFNAIISASVVALGVSYAIPPAINCLRGRKMLPETRPFVLPGPLGWVANLVGIAYVIVTTVLFVFPPELPVSGRYVLSLLTYIFYDLCFQNA